MRATSIFLFLAAMLSACSSSNLRSERNLIRNSEYFDVTLAADSTIMAVGFQTLEVSLEADISQALLLGKYNLDGDVLFERFFDTQKAVGQQRDVGLDILNLNEEELIIGGRSLQGNNNLGILQSSSLNGELSQGRTMASPAKSSFNECRQLLRLSNNHLVGLGFASQKNRDSDLGQQSWLVDIGEDLSNAVELVFGDGEGTLAVNSISPHKNGFMAVGDSIFNDAFMRTPWLAAYSSNMEPIWVSSAQVADSRFFSTNTKQAFVNSDSSITILGDFYLPNSDFNVGYIMDFNPEDGSIRKERAFYYEERNDNTVRYSSVRSAIRSSLDSNYIFTGYLLDESNSFSNVWVSKVDKGFNTIWEREFGIMDNDAGNSIIELSDGSLLVVGFQSSPLDNRSKAIIYKLDSEGRELWRRQVE